MRGTFTGSQSTMLANNRDRVRSLLNKMNLVPSRHPPFLSRRYPYRGRA
jgi:hypothetical protein